MSDNFNQAGFEYRGQFHPYELSIEQKNVVDWALDGSGNGIVSAGAGSGKTSTLKALCKYLFSGKMSAGFFAFNKHIAVELHEEFSKDIYKDLSEVFCATMHSTGYKAVLYNFKLNYSQLFVSGGKYRKFFEDVCSSEQHSDKKDLLNYIDEITKIFDLVRSHCMPIEKLAVQNIEWLVYNYSINMNNPETGTVTVDYSKIVELIKFGIDWGKNISQHKQLDYTDMLYIPFSLKMRPLQFKWVFVDEAQDLNPLQRFFIQKCMKWGARIIFVGDRFQAIYGFAGASVDSIDKIKKHFNAYEMPLNVCYRCPKSHISLAQEIVPEIRPTEWAIEGEIFNRQYQDSFEFVKPGDLIICRMNAPLVKYCFSLIARGIPANIRGRDIGKNMADLVNKISKSRTFSWENFEEEVNNFFQKKIEKILKKNNGDQKDPEIQDQNDKMEALLSLKEAINPSSCQNFIDKIFEIFSESENKDEEKKIVWLSTVHKAKGLQADNVFILRPDKLPLNHPKMLNWQHDQEMNLKYVALTRAKKTLTFVLKEEGEE